MFSSQMHLREIVIQGGQTSLSNQREHVTVVWFDYCSSCMLHAVQGVQEKKPKIRQLTLLYMLQSYKWFLRCFFLKLRCKLTSVELGSLGFVM